VLAVTQLRALWVTVGCADVWMCGSREESPLTMASSLGKKGLPRLGQQFIDLGP